LRFLNKKVCCLLLLLIHVAGCSSNVSRGQAAFKERSLADKQAQASDSEQVRSLLRGLGSTDNRKRGETKTAVLALSDNSSTTRQIILSELIKIADMPCPYTVPPFRNARWEDAVELLGSLKALESLNVLTHHLDCTTGASLAPDMYPATKAIIRFGQPAIAALRIVLKEGRTSERFMAAQALWAIGGDEAKDAITRAADTEKDKHLVRIMKDLLSRWNDTKQPPQGLM